MGIDFTELYQMVAKYNPERAEEAKKMMPPDMIAAKDDEGEAVLAGQGSRGGTVTMQFGRNRKSPSEVLEEKGYWPGEWLCMDCGYIYEPGTPPAFEELR